MVLHIIKKLEVIYVVVNPKQFGMVMFHATQHATGKV
jgi:hypothetical protein